MRLKGETALNLFITVLFAYSLSYFISSLALLKVKPCKKFSLSLYKTVPQRFNLSYNLEREGFFLSRGKKERIEEVPQETITSFETYTLKGTVICSKCGHSIAILKDSSGKTLIVSEGQEIAGYKVEKVYPEEVVLSKGRRKFILKLKGKETLERKRTYENGKTFFIRRREIINQISTGDFLKYINIVPIKNPEGLKVNYVHPKSFIYKLGIRPGDIILSINEIRIRTPEDSFAAFEKLKSADSITITVLRRGREVKLNYEIE